MQEPSSGSHYAPPPQHISPQQPQHGLPPPPHGPPGHGHSGPIPMRSGTPIGWQGQQHHLPLPHAGQRVGPGQGSFICAASPLSQHVTSGPPMGLQGSPVQGQATGPYSPPSGASRPSGAPPMGGHQQPPPNAEASGPPQGGSKVPVQKVPEPPKHREYPPLIVMNS